MSSMSHFFAYLSRMKLIERWSLMYNTRKENVQEHSLQVAIIAHALAVIKNKYFDGDVDTSRVALMALFHDATEVITGDLPTPVKYFNSEIKTAYKDIEAYAGEQLLKLLPRDLRPEYSRLLQLAPEDKNNSRLIKQADILCAYIKCLEEAAAGNREFEKARKSLEHRLAEESEPQVQYFIEHFLPSFSLSLDELSDPFAHPMN